MSAGWVLGRGRSGCPHPSPCRGEPPARDVSVVVNQAGREASDRPASYSPIVELRRYTLTPGTREVLIRLFEDTFVEPQEEAAWTRAVAGA
jgi:hypothetical protein